jgi:hypothetical protein
VDSRFKKKNLHESRRETIWEGEGDQQEWGMGDKRIMGDEYNQSALYTWMKMS